MGQQSATQFPRTTAAIRRLEEAVAMLESASGAAVQDRQALSAELEALRQDCAALDGVNREVTERLDAAIERLGRVLGG